MKRPQIDFKRVKEEASIFQVAEHLGLKLKRDTDGFRCPCPNDEHDTRGIKITPGYKNKDGTLGAFYCHVCKQNGDAIGLYAHIKGVRNYDAAVALTEAFHIGPAPKAEKKQHTAQPENGPMQPLDYLEPEHPVIDMLGLERAAMEALGAGYAPRGTMRGRILIPLRLPDGSLVGYMAIATDAEQSPLLKFPDNLAERCQAKPQPREQADEPSPDQLRKLFRVVG